MASATIGSLRVNLAIDTAAFDKGIKQVSSRLKTVGKRMSIAGASLTAGITLPLIAFATKSVEAFKQSEDALAQVEAAIKSTGGAVGFTTKQLAKMAAGLQSVSTFDDDEILQNVTAQLLKFGSVTGDTFAKAQQAILDFSARTGTSLQASTQLIGKALENPVKSLTLLRRAGVTFTAEQEALIKNLVATGRAAEAQGIILDVLTGKFGGAAAAMAKTTSGAQAQAWNAISDAMEAVGEVVARVIPPIANAIKTAAEWFLTLNPRVQEFIIIAGGIAAILGPALVALGLMATALAAIGAPIALAIAGFVALTAAVAAYWPEIKKAWQETDAFLISLGADFDAKMAEFGQAFVRMADVAIEAIVRLVTAVQEWLGRKLLGILRSAVSTVQSLGDKFKWLYESVVGKSWVPDMVTETEGWMDRLGTSFGSSIKGLIDGTMSWKDALGDLLKTVAKVALEGFAKSPAGGGFLGSLATALSGQLSGFARGGSFKVGGSGGIDSQLMAFRASPGEMVDIHKPGNDNARMAQVVVRPEIVVPPGYQARTEEVSDGLGGVKPRTFIEKIASEIGGNQRARQNMGLPPMVRRYA